MYEKRIKTLSLYKLGNIFHVVLNTWIEYIHIITVNYKIPNTYVWTYFRILEEKMLLENIYEYWTNFIIKLF